MTNKEQYDFYYEQISLKIGALGEKNSRQVAELNDRFLNAINTQMTSAQRFQILMAINADCDCEMRELGLVAEYQ